MTRTFLLIARKNGSSSTRRQRHFPDMPAVERAIQRWRTVGYNTWWIFEAGGGPLVREWVDPKGAAEA